MPAITSIAMAASPTETKHGGTFSPKSQKLQVTGTAVPAGATGVLLNVTVVGPSAAGFLSVRPGDATGAEQADAAGRIRA